MLLVLYALYTILCNITHPLRIHIFNVLYSLDRVAICTRRKTDYFAPQKYSISHGAAVFGADSVLASNQDCRGCPMFGAIIFWNTCKRHPSSIGLKPTSEMYHPDPCLGMFPHDNTSIGWGRMTLIGCSTIYFAGRCTKFGTRNRFSFRRVKFRLSEVCWPYLTQKCWMPIDVFYDSLQSPYCISLIVYN